MIVNNALARRYFPGIDPIGQQVAIEMMSPVVPSRIIGVVGDTKNTDLSSDTRPMSYWPHPLLPYNAMTLVVRSTSDATHLAPLVDAQVHALDPEQPTADVKTMDQWIAKSLAQSRFSSLLLAAFAAVALLLAAIGVYGVMSYTVSQRTAEIGVRLALGAETRDILAMVLASAGKLTAIGLAVGVALAFALSRTLSSFLFHVTSTDPATFLGAIAVLACSVLLATFLPARRAARTSPADALRYQ